MLRPSPLCCCAASCVHRYFIVTFGMQGLFRLVLGEGSETDDMMGGMMPGMGGMGGQPMPGQPVDNNKVRARRGDAPCAVLRVVSWPLLFSLSLFS